MGGIDSDMVDVNSQIAAEPSLQRLKALDSLPDLQSQLKTASEFCNHGFRAEMILKWLISKLQNDKQACRNEIAWTLLEKCFRLVAPHKLGNLLARFNVVFIAQTAIQSLQDHAFATLMSVIAGSIETLEEISSGPDGAPVKQLLSTESASAASFLGAWAKAVDSLLQTTDVSETDANELVHLAAPAIRLWANRKPGNLENDAFAENCLIPCALLLHNLKSRDPSGSSTKRRRGEHAGSLSRANSSEDLEVFIARHVFLPARSAFFQTSDSEKNILELRGKLACLRAQIEVVDETSKHLCEALPNLLDIALRCIPMTTARQRSKERPWVEAVFLELLTCIEHDGKLRSQAALVIMLQVVGKRASLPSATLKDIVRRHSNLSPTEKFASADVALIAEIVALDPTIFLEKDLANQLFPALTTASKQMLSADNTDSKNLLVRSIAQPIMRAFASSRKLGDFVQRWHQQLLMADKPLSWTVWTQLDDGLAELLESHLTVDQVEGLFDSVRAQGAASSKNTWKSTDGLSASSHWATATVLLALLKGIKSDEYVARLQGRLGEIMHTTLALVEDSKVNAVSPQVWLMLGLSFELWFPTWAAAQQDPNSVSDKARSILSHPGLKRIVKARISGKDVEHAEIFIGLVCSRLKGYDECHQLAAGLVASLSKSSTDVSLAFLSFPDLLVLLEKDARQDMISSVADSAIVQVSTKGNSEHFEKVTAFVGSALIASHSKLSDEVISAILKASDSQGKNSQQEHAVLDLMLQLPVASLTRGQRERILDWVVGLDFGVESDESRISKRYAVMIRLMQLPNATALLCTDASALWSLCRTSAAPKKKKPGKEKKEKASMATTDAASVELLQDVVRSVAVYLLSTQDQERSRLMLRNLVQEAVQRMGRVDLEDGSSCDQLAIISTIVQCTEGGLGKGVFAHLTDDFAPLVAAFAARIVEEAQSSVKALKKQDEVEGAGIMPKLLLELLICLRRSRVVGETDDKAITKLCNKVLSRNSDDTATTGKTRHSASGLLLPAFILLAQIKGFEACSSLGEALLKSTLSPKDRQSLVEELRKMAKLSNSVDRISVLKSIVPDTKSAGAQAITVMQNALTAFTRETAAKDEKMVHALYLQLLETLQGTSDFASYTASVSCLLTTIREKPFMLNQHLTEETLRTIQALSRPSPAERLVYLDLCSILSALLLHHRARLQGRFHLLIATLQTLQGRLFVQHKSASESRRPLASRHARAYTRLLTLLCNPPTRTHNNASNKRNDLVDETRRARAHVGQYVPTLLHSFCAQVLSGALGEGVREALTPGLWAVIEAMEVRSPEAVKALSAGMNNSERAVLRSVYDEWKKFGKWEGA